ncbi:pathogen-associated molecular patterns-induced protein A70-like [Lolium rigidum]|uniref:pathogen-associated molecular patterns-induced protein A70-like n=1 Tax=Lolium rigidum TaxID=89674 RepID=UPI001F5E044D|nr:pathogen-associated molecular patterns-induced protein A70-like [Lolium rigidum]
MDAADVIPAWSLVRGYFSPATLFLLLNVVIGTIALTSRRRHNHHHDDHHHQQQHQKDYVDQYDAAPRAPAPLARTSSVMERLRSLGLYRFRSGDFPPEYNYSLSAGDDDESNKQHQQQAQYARSRSEPAAAKPPTNRTGNGAEKAAKAKVAKKPLSEVRRLERAPAPAPARLVQRAPRAPVARAVVTAAATEAAPAACVDERADDFINKFRQQLQLQRLNSLLNYKEMLNRGT